MLFAAYITETNLCWQDRMKLTDEEVEECFQGAYGHGTEIFEKAKNMKEEAMATKRDAAQAKKSKPK